jgi:choline dehydrogenase-like flavoprotein
MIYDVIVVGSGAAGAWAAYGAAQKNLNVLVIDAGLHPAPDRKLEKNIFDLRANDSKQRDYLLGQKYESLHNVYQDYLSPKLKAPRYRYVIAEPDEHMHIHKEGFDALQSYSLGGLANAWGAGTYRYTDFELQSFPYNQADLDPYYDTITTEIGIAGQADDLTDYFGSLQGVQKPLRLDRQAQHLLNTYTKKKKRFQKKGITLGYPRIAILSEDLGKRKACQYDNLSFWQPQLPAIYSPAMTMEQLIEDNKVTYLDNRLVLKYIENESEVSVEVLSLKDKSLEIIKGKKMILAAGALNSAKIVLNSNDDFETQLPLLENPTSLIPFVCPGAIGNPVENESHGLIQLNLLYEGKQWEEKVQASIYGYSSPLGADVAMNFPLSFKAMIASCKYLLPAMMIIQLFYADSPKKGNYVQLAHDRRLKACYEKRNDLGAVEKEMINTMRAAGMLSHPLLVQYPPPGNGIHYAGTLPMQENGTPYSTTSEGRLQNTKHVYVADAAVFPKLPAKNHTLTIMANAYRTAVKAAEALV